jgi:ADP-ribosyl-[dinitrogen reductase] hydrolase
VLGAIAGDIVGSRFEHGPAPQPGFTLFHRDCRFTDDSVCSLAVADALLGTHDFAASLRAFVRRHPTRGYGKMFLDWAMSDDAPAYGSWANGAPMRVAAVGWLARNEDEARAWAAAQANVSHDHPDAVAAAQAVALTILLARQGLSAAALRRRITKEFGYELTPRIALRGGGFDVSASGTVQSALTAAFESESWEGAVRTCIRLGGDTDTLACIAGAVAEAFHGVPDDVAGLARAQLTDDLAAVLARFEAAVGSPGRLGPPSRAPA